MGTFIIIIIILIVGYLLFKVSNDSDEEDASYVKTKTITKTPSVKKMKSEYNESIDIAKDFLQNKEKYVILDTETTGLGDNDVVIQIGIIDLDGNILLDTLIKPSKRKRISSEATNIHGIKMIMLKDSPTFKEIYQEFRNIIKGKKVLIYNNQFDIRLINQTAQQDNLRLDDFETICLMKLYAIFKNNWSEYHGWYKYPKLPEGDHSAIGDCKSALKILHKISEGDKDIS